MQQDEKVGESFVKYFVEAHGANYDPELLVATLGDLIGAGMESTATFIRWAIVLLANHVSVQERLHTEIDSVIGRKRLPALEDRSRWACMFNCMHTRNHYVYRKGCVCCNSIVAGVILLLLETYIFRIIILFSYSLNILLPMFTDLHVFVRL